MLKFGHCRQIRRSLALTTALASGCLIASAANAQSLPVPGDATTVAVTGGINPQISQSGQTLTVDLRASGTVIDWNGFNIPGQSTVRFNDSRPLVQGLSNIAVLNRDVSGTTTTISGNLTSESNVAVWVYNSHGILIGGGARINTGSLVLTTLEPDQGDFLSGNGYSLRGADTLTAGITVQAGARISVAGGNRGLILVAPKIDADGTFTADNQDVAFVTATDVTLDYNTGSPLTVVLNKGTSVAGASQIVRGTVSGRDVTFALASRSSVTDALLNIGASVTTATSGERGIVLLAGRPSGSIDGVSVGGTAAQTGGLVGLTVSGELTANAGDIIAAGSGAVTLSRALDADRDVRVTAGRLATISGQVTAGQDYLVTGAGVTLGSATTPVTQQALRNVSITANNGTLSGLGALTLIGDANGNGNGDLTLTTAGSAGGNIAFGSGTQLRGGEDGEADVRIRVRAASNTIALGNVTASALLGAVGSAAFANGLSIDGALTLGNVDVASAIALRSAAMTTGALRSDDAITLAATGAMRIGAIDADGSVSLTGTGATVVGGAVIARGGSDTILIQRDGAVTIGGNVSAGRDVTIGATATPAASIAIQGAVSGRNISLIASGAQTLRGDVTARGTLGVAAGTTLIMGGQTRADGNVSLRADGMRLADVVSTDGTLTALAGAGGIIGTSSAGARLGADGTLVATATGGALSIAQAASERSGVALTGTGIAAGTLTAASDVIVDGGSSVVSVAGAVTAGGSYRVTGGTVTLGNSGTVTQAADGLVAINGGAGGITGLGTLTLQSNADGAGSEALTLAIADTAPTGAITFSGNSTLAGGTTRQSDVHIRSGSADGSVLLGDVAARGLFGAVGTATYADGLVRNTALRVGDVRLSRALILNGAGVTAGDLASDGAVTLISNGALVARSIDAGGNATLVGTGATTISGLLQTRGAGNDVVINRDGALRIGSLQAGGALAIGTALAPATLDIGAASSGGALTARAVGAQIWRGAITAGGAVTLSGDTLSTRDIRSTGGAISLTSTIGALSAGVIDAAGLTTLTSAGTLSATSVRGGGGVRATAGGNLTIGGLIDGGNGSVVVTSSGGTARLTGGVTARGDYRVTGQSVILGGTQTANGAVAINTTAGGLSGQSGLVLTANGDGAGSEAMTLETVGGDLVLAGNSVLNGGTAQQSNVVLRSSGGLTLGAVDARSLAINDGARLAGPLTTGNLSLARGLTLLGGAGGIWTGTITIGAGNLLIDAIDGTVTTNTIAVGGTVSLSGAGIDFTNITGTAVTLQSVGAIPTGIDGNNITASGPVTLTAVSGGGVSAGTIATTGSAGAVTIRSSDTVDLNRITAGGTATITTETNPADILIANGLTATGTVRLTSTHDIRALFVTSTNGSLFLLAPTGSLTGYAPGSTIALSTGSGLTLDVGQAVRLGALTGGAISLRADTIEIDSIDVGNNLVDLFADSGDLEINGGIRGGTVTLNSTGTTSIGGAVVASGAVNLSGLRVTFGDLTGASLNVQSIGAGATGIRGGDVTVSGMVMLNAVEGSGGIETGVITTTGTSGAVAISSVGAIGLDGVNAGGTATITTLTNPADIVIRGGLTADGAVQLTSTRDVRAPFVTSTNGALSILARNGSLTGIAPGSSVALSAGAGLTLDVGQAVRLGALTGGAISLRADTIEIDSIDVGSNLVDLFADSGDLTIDGGIRGGTVTLNATGATSIGDAIVASGAVSLSGQRVAFGDLTAASVTVQSTGTNATGITGGAITASGPVRLNAVEGSGGITTGVITTSGATGAVAIASVGTIALDGVNASGTATVTTQTNPADVLISGGLTASGAVQISSTRDVRARFITSTNGALSILAPNGSLTGFAPGSTIALSAGAGLTLDIGQAVRLGALTGGAISLQASSIEIDSIDVGSNLVDLFADSGNLTIDGGVRGGTVILNASGVTRVDGAIDASGSLSVSGTAGLDLNSVRGSGVTLNSGGAIDAGTVVSGGALSATGTQVALGSITAGGLATLKATSGTLGVGALSANGGLDALATGDVSIASLDVSAGSARVVSSGDAQLGAAIVSGDLAVQAAGSATLLDNVAAGGAYTVRGGTILLGGAGIVQRAGGQIALASTSGGISAGSGLSLLGNRAGGASAMLIDAAGAIALGATTIDNGGGALGLRAGSGAGVTLGAITAGTIGGIATAADGSTSATDTFQHDAGFTAGDIVARDIGILLSAGAIGVGDITTSGATRLTTRDAITTGDVRAATIDVAAGAALGGGVYTAGGTARIVGGSVALDRLVAGGAGTVTSQGSLAIDSASGAALTIGAAGDITGRGTARALLTTTGGDLTVDGKALVRLGDVGVAGAASISGGDIDIGGTLSVARTALVKARNALTLGDATAGATLTLDAGGALSAQALRAGGDALVTAAGNATVASLDSGGALTIKGSNVTLGNGRATGAALIDATGLATLGQLFAGPTLTIRASDATLTGIQRAASVAFENRTADTTALRLGDGTANDGFRLSDAEIKLVEADSLTFRQGNGAVEIGTLAFDADAGRRSVDIMGTGAIAVRGTVSGTGAGRRFRLGGDASDGGLAREINVVATSDAGGRLLFEGADLELRGTRIAVGVAPGFIDALTGATFEQVVAGFVGNANSSLYNANLGGGFYDAAAQTTVSANSLTVRYGDYALFQNTGTPGQSAGIVLGGVPGSPALTLLPASPTTNAFAAFGTINGISGTAAALLGSGVVSLGQANLGTTRINGCLVGSGAGCLAAIVIQPTLQVFETTQQDVFGSVESLDVPFDPVVSGSNEELLTGLATMGPRAACEEGDTDCANAEETPK